MLISFSWRLVVLNAAMVLALCFTPFASSASATPRPGHFPVDMDQLMAALTDAHVPSEDKEKFPRVVDYPYTRWNMMNDTLETTMRKVRIPKKPVRIIPHSVALAEILWAIADRKDIAAVHATCRDPNYSFLAGKLPPSLRTYDSQDAEVVIGLQPDLILTTYYSSAEFKNRLRLSSIPFVEMGFFWDFHSIEEQIGILGELIGEEPSAKRLVGTMETNIAAIRKYVRSRARGKPLTALYYSEMGFVAGTDTTFDSFCSTLGVRNVAAANGVKFFKQVSYETVLKWDPDIIVVPEGSGLSAELTKQEILRTAKAVRNGRIRTIPNVYLMASSQYAVASLNYLGGLLYGP